MLSLVFNLTFEVTIDITIYCCCRIRMRCSFFDVFYSKPKSVVLLNKWFSKVVRLQITIWWTAFSFIVIFVIILVLIFLVETFSNELFNQFTMIVLLLWEESLKLVLVLHRIKDNAIWFVKQVFFLFNALNKLLRAK